MVATYEGNMTNETNENVQEPIAQAQEVQQEEIQSSQDVAQSNEQTQNNPADNWKAANEVLRLQKQRIEELESRIQQQTHAEMQKQVVEEEDEFASLDQEDYLTVGKARHLAGKLAEKQAKKAAEEIIQKYMHEQNVSNDEQRARGKYEDYDYVVDNFAVPLIKNDPALAHKVMTSKNPAETAYKLGKLSDTYEDQMGKQQVSPRAEKILRNSSRPVSGAAVGSPLKTQADQFSKLDPRESGDRQKIWEMSQKYAKGG